jgi:hypothetical protein
MNNDNWYNVLFSIVSGALTQAQRDRLGQLDVSFELLNTRGGRFYIDIIGPRGQLQALQDYLTAQGRDPRVIGIFRYDDARNCSILVGQLDLAEYVAVAPNILVYNQVTGVVVSNTRPAAFVETHEFAGWGAKVLA